MADLSKLLTPDDKQIIDATGANNWVPPDPREILVPYMPDKESKETKQGIEGRRDKAKQVLDGYADIVAKCKRLEAEIEERCKNVVVDITDPNYYPVRKAMARVFGPGEHKQITFQQYKICVQELAKYSSNMPKPEDKS